MPVSVERYNQVGVLTVGGELDHDAAEAMRALLREQVDQNHLADFVVELSACPFINSQGLEALLELKKTTEDLFGQLKLVGLDENCRQILEITRLAHRFQCQADLESALKTMR